jgi:DNA-binding transcriptional LysR family regulator
LKSERFIISLSDPGPEIKEVLRAKLSLSGDQPFIKHVKAHHSAMISAVDGDRGITLACESSSIPPWPRVVFREVRDGNGPTRLSFVAYWRRNNCNPTLKKFLTWLKAHPAVPAALVSAIY